MQTIYHKKSQFRQFSVVMVVFLMIVPVVVVRINQDNTAPMIPSPVITPVAMVKPSPVMIIIPVHVPAEQAGLHSTQKKR